MNAESKLGAASTTNDSSEEINKETEVRLTKN